MKVKKILKHKNKNKGFTLVDLLIAIAVLSVGFLPLLSSFPRLLKDRVRSENASISTNLLASKADEIRAMGLTTLNGASSGNGNFSNYDPTFKDFQWSWSLSSISAPLDSFIKKVTLTISYVDGQTTRTNIATIYVSNVF